MRIIVAALAILIAGAATHSAQADPYRWCVDYAGRPGGTNCYFITLEQCRAAASGNGGFCRPNNFYDGRPVTTPEDAYPRSRKRRQQ